MSADPSEQATPKNKAFAFLAIRLTIGLLLLMIIGARSNGRFLPTSYVVTGGVAATIALIIALGVYSFYYLRARVPDYDPSMLLVVPLAFLPFVIYAWIFGASAFINGFPDIYTRIFGDQGIRQVTTTSRTGQSRGRHVACDGAYIAEIPDWLGRLCLDKRVDAGEPLILRGRHSALGFHVDSIDTGQ